MNTFSNKMMTNFNSKNFFSNYTAFSHDVTASILVFQNNRAFHSRDQHLCKFMGTKESIYVRKEINSQRIGLEHQLGRRFTVSEHQYGRRDVPNGGYVGVPNQS